MLCECPITHRFTGLSLLNRIRRRHSMFVSSPPPWERPKPPRGGFFTQKAFYRDRLMIFKLIPPEKTACKVELQFPV